MGKRVIGLCEQLSENEADFEGGNNLQESIQIIKNFFSREDDSLDKKFVGNNDENYMSWQKFLHPGISVINEIYHRDDETFFLQEAAIAKITTPVPELLSFLMEHHGNFRFPYRYAIKDGLLLIHLHVFLEGITREHLELRLECFETFVVQELEFLMEGFGLKPLMRPNHISLLK